MGDTRNNTFQTQPDLDTPLHRPKGFPFYWKLDYHTFSCRIHPGISRITSHKNNWTLIALKKRTVYISTHNPIIRLYQNIRLDSKLDDQDMNECLFIFMVHHKLRGNTRN